MTKKKPKSNATANNNPQNHNQKPPETDKKATELSRQSSMEDHDSSEEKLQSLKSLNAMLLKQTVEKRQQIDSLIKDKNELETELTRYCSEKSELRDELDQVSDENLRLKMGLALVMDFFKNRFSEIAVGVERLMKEKEDRENEIRVLKIEANEVLRKVEIDREHLKKVCNERDSIKNEFELQCEETNRLKESVILLVEKESGLEIVIGGLKSENEKLTKERRMSEEMIEGLNKEKIELEKTIEEKVKEIDGLKRGIEVLLDVKNEIEIIKNDHRVEIEELEKRLGKLSDHVIELEKNLDESIEKRLQIDAIVKEKMVKESEVKRLMNEKDSVEKQMEIVNVQSSDKDKLIDQLSREKIELEGRVFDEEAKHVELNLKVDELENTVAALQKDCNDRTKTNEKLCSQVRELRVKLEQVEVAREEADKELGEEKRHGEDLKAEVSKSEKLFKTTLEELEKIKTERESLSKAKKDLENHSRSLESEKVILEKELVELKKAMDALKTELESAGMDAKRSLVMLKSALSIVSQSENRGNGTESSALEIESIEKAFRNKEKLIEEMKKEAETMKQLTEEVRKKKSFWTVVSSVTTVFAAASFAYASRSR